MRWTRLLVVLLMPICVAEGSSLDSRGAFVPDVYPSKLSAVAALAEQVADDLANNGRPDPAPRSMIVHGECCDEALTSVVAAVKRQIPGINASTAPAPPDDAADGQIVIEVLVSDVREFTNPLDADCILSRGQVTLTAAGGGYAARAFNARYVDTPWMDDWNSFTGSQESGRWVRAESGALVASQELALSAARAAAADSLAPRVRARMQARGGAAVTAMRLDERWGALANRAVAPAGPVHRRPLRADV